MSIAMVVPEDWEPSRLVYWSAMIARAKGEDLLVIRPRPKANSCDGKKISARHEMEDSQLAAAILEHASDFTIVDPAALPKGEPARRSRNTDDTRRRIFTKYVSGADAVKRILQEIRDWRVNLLILPRHRGVRFDAEAFSLQRELFLHAPCETLQLSPGKKTAEPPGSIVVAASNDQHTRPALKLSAQFAAGDPRKITALHVKEDGEPAPREQEQKKLDRAVRKSLKADAPRVTQDAVVDENVPRGVASYARENGHELVIVGAAGNLSGDREILASVPEKLLAESDEPTLVVIRKAIPLPGRILKSVEQRKKEMIPQLDREGRVELAERLEQSANWDFDFAFLMCLATLLAAFGLSLDSPAVVIGAMLIAPLMTPMVGVGLSVVQGNRKLAAKCLGTVARGLLMAFATGFAVGLVRLLFTSGVTNEITNRGAPGVLDLLVAFASGLVAAYAFGRPHLLSVLPGIAIATALVPPVAAVALSLWTFDLNIALGAMLLFCSNFVAIVLGSACVLWLVGMRGPREICPFTNWSRKWVLGLCAGAVCLGLFNSVKPEPTAAEAAPVAESDPSERRLPTRGQFPHGEPLEGLGAPSAAPGPPPEIHDPANGEPPAERIGPREQATRPGPSESPQNIRIVFKPPLKPGEESAGENLSVEIPIVPPSLDETQSPPQPQRTTARRRTKFFLRALEAVFSPEENGTGESTAPGQTGNSPRE